MPMIGLFKRMAEKTILDRALKGLGKWVEGCPASARRPVAAWPGFHWHRC